MRAAPSSVRVLLAPVRSMEGYSKIVPVARVPHSGPAHRAIPRPSQSGGRRLRRAPIDLFSQAQVFISLHCVVQKSYCAMGQRLLQRPSYGCLYKGSASSARRRNRSPPAAHRTSLAMNFNVYSHAPMDLGYWVASPSKHRARWAAHRARRAAAARSVPRTRRVRPRKARLFSSSPVARSWPRRIRSRSTSRARLYIEPLSKCNQVAKTTPTAAEAVCTAPFPLR